MSKVNYFIFSILCLTITSMLSCGNKTVDLSVFDKINMNELNNLKLKRVDEQNGSWEILNNDVELKKNGIKSKHLYFNYKEEFNQVSFSKFKIDTESGLKVVTSNNELSFFSIKFNENELFSLINFLKNNLGNSLNFKQNLNPNIYKNQIKLLKKNTPKDLNKIQDDIEGEVYTYSNFYLWEKEKFVVFLKLGLTSDNFSNELVFISKKALKDKIVFGYHNVKEDIYLNKVKI